MKKKIIFSIVLVLLLTTTIVFGAFKFVEVINNTAKSADLEYSSNLISYQDSNHNEYRADMAYKVEFELKRGIKYIQTEDTTYKSNKTYYTKNDDTYTALDASSYTIGSAIADNTTLYEQTTTYLGASAVNSIITKSKTLSTDNYSITTDAITSLINKVTIKVDDSNNIVLSDITTNDEGIDSITIDNDKYKVIVDASKTSCLILDTTTKNPYKTIKDSTDATKDATKVTCRATNEVATEDSNAIYLNQLGIKVDITTKIACYVRINIEDAWIRTRQYATNVETKYIAKDQINGESPFKQTGNDYYYDAVNNTIYLKTVITPQLNENGTYETRSFIFNVNEGYYYINSTNQFVYEDYIKVELTYHVDIVQANRVEAVWGLDPSTLN